MRGLVYGIVALVALQRLAELLYAQHNTRSLLARGAHEVGRNHYALIVLVHAGWLAAIVILVPQPASIAWSWLVIFGALQAARVWIIASLGRFWTTRIITVKDAPLVRRGPYRFMRHPNYLIVALEIAVLPLAFREYGVAILFSILNAGVLAWRIREEERVLAPRRASQESLDGAIRS
jgi:methyltransferase